MHRGTGPAGAAVGPVDEETEDGKPLPKVRVIDRLWYRLDGVGFIYERRQHLFLIDMAGGEPVQLTHDRLQKMSPVFSSDGLRIAYTTADPPSHWDTWIVSALGGEPHLWLTNAAALSWIAVLRDEQLRLQAERDQLLDAARQMKSQAVVAGQMRIGRNRRMVCRTTAVADPMRIGRN